MKSWFFALDLNNAPEVGRVIISCLRKSWRWETWSEFLMDILLLQIMLRIQGYPDPAFCLLSYITTMRTEKMSWTFRKKAGTYLKYCISVNVSENGLESSRPDVKTVWKILKEMGISDHLTCLLKNLYAGQEAIVRTGHGIKDWFQIGKGVCQSCILSLCLFNSCRVHHETC